MEQPEEMAPRHTSRSRAFDSLSTAADSELAWPTRPHHWACRGRQLVEVACPCRASTSSRARTSTCLRRSRKSSLEPSTIQPSTATTRDTPFRSARATSPQWSPSSRTFSASSRVASVVWCRAGVAQETREKKRPGCAVWRYVALRIWDFYLFLCLWRLWCVRTVLPATRMATRHPPPYMPLYSST